VKILFITSNRLGDAVLSTGVLSYLIEHTIEPEITVACGPLAAGIFADAPGVVNVIALKKEPYAGHWRKLWKLCIRTKWDIIIDLRDSAVSRLLRADKRYIWGVQDKTCHKVEQNAQIMGLDMPPAPKIWFSAEVEEMAERLIPDGDSPVLAIGPAANWAGKTWGTTRFSDLIYRLTSPDLPDAPLPDFRVAVFAAPGEEDIARSVLESVPQNRQIDVIAKTSPVEAAAAIKRCVYYIGNDSGLMHCAAAVGIPTFGLFGPSYPYLYRPWGKHCAYLATPQTFDELIDFEGYDVKTVGSLMNSLETTDVYNAITKHLDNILSH